MRLIRTGMTASDVPLNLGQMADSLRSMEREGAASDVPEGTRFIKISHTYANLMADWLDEMARALQGVTPSPSDDLPEFIKQARQSREENEV